MQMYWYDWELYPCKVWFGNHHLHLGNGESCSWQAVLFKAIFRHAWITNSLIMSDSGYYTVSIFSTDSVKNHGSFWVIIVRQRKMTLFACPPCWGLVPCDLASQWIYKILKDVAQTEEFLQGPWILLSHSWHHELCLYSVGTKRK